MEQYKLKRTDINHNSVRGHSIVREIIFGAIDLNASDPYANIQKWQSFCNVLLKGETEWRRYIKEGKSVDVDFEYKGYKIHEIIDVDRGLLKALHQLELPDVKSKIETEKRIEEIEKTKKELATEKKGLLKKLRK